MAGPTAAAARGARRRRPVAAVGASRWSRLVPDRRRDRALAATATLLALNALRLRARAERLGAVAAAEGDVAASTGWTLVRADGVEVDAGARAAAERHAADADLDVLELVPADLGAEEALDLLTAVDPGSYRTDRLAPGRGANQAVLLSDAVVARLAPALRALVTAEPPSGRSAPAGAASVVEGDVARLLEEAKRCAPTSADLAVVEGVRAAAASPARRRAVIDHQFGGAAPMARWAPVLGTTALLGSVVLSPLWGTAALVAHALQPVVALGGTALGRGRRRTATRPLASLVRAVRVVAETEPATGDVEHPTGARSSAERDRDEVEELLAGGTGRFFEAPVDTCPWCGSAQLRPAVRCTDVLQGKPGTFQLDRCGWCGHVFQNPRLTPEGLDFYYRDFYDGPGEAETDAVFGSSAAPYRGRAAMVRRAVAVEPARWLDVGAGHGHFCLVAAEAFPDTRFEALDLSESVDVARRRGWVADAHRGLFPDLAYGLDGYDVVSMHHYLEHTREPNDELKAARRVLRPAGHLLIEVPDPECVAGRLLGRWWVGWFQPQHQHLVPLDNLCEALEAEGFTIVATERSEAHQPVEAAMAVWFLLNALAPPTEGPWRPRPDAAAIARRWAVFCLGAPLVAAALAIDALSGPVVRRLPGGSNAYRVLARLD